MTEGIYQIFCHVGPIRRYIGQSINIEHRLQEHFSQLKNNHHQNKELQDLYNKFGLEGFYSGIIEETTSLKSRELFWMYFFEDEIVNSIPKYFNWQGKLMHTKIKNEVNQIKQKTV